MTQQMQPLPFTVEDVARKWAGHLSQEIIATLQLEKQIETQAKVIEELRTNEAALVDHIQHLEEEVKDLSARLPLPSNLGPVAEKLAREGKKIIDAARTKKPPEGG